jgi:hypothetical protein
MTNSMVDSKINDPEVLKQIYLFLKENIKKHFCHKNNQSMSNNFKLAVYGDGGEKNLIHLKKELENQHL